MVSIGALLPFLTILISPEHIIDLNFLKSFLFWLGFSQSSQLLLPITLSFIILIIISGLTRLTLLWMNSSVSYAAGTDISINIFNRTLHQDYLTHCSRNSSEIINSISSKSASVIFTFNNLLIFVSSCFLLTAIFSTLVLINPLIVGLTFSLFVIIYLVMNFFHKKKLVANSKIIADKSSKVIKSIQEGLGGIRDILLDSSQEFYCDLYKNSSIPLRKAQSSNLYISASPRFIVESMSLITLAALAYFFLKLNYSIAYLLPSIGAFMFGLQRMLPLMQQTYSSLTNIQSIYASLSDVVSLLDQPFPRDFNKAYNKPLFFNNKISLRQLSFKYSNKAPLILKNINLSIKRGSCIGVIGTTGSGKSTLLDILMGLLEPTTGYLEVDDVRINYKNKKSWQNHIAHVPQAIFLADVSIAENIAFGVPEGEINFERVRLAAKYAQIDDTIEKLPYKYKTCIGERGVKLSGGQRQRLGIARALYKNADVVIFDEATSALDSKTERAVMDSILKLNNKFTLIIIAHRLTTLKKCSKIIELEHGKIKRIGSYKKIMSKKVTAK
jgi:ABC-type multidrug transport system fused ATPase/permease subunit